LFSGWNAIAFCLITRAKTGLQQAAFSWRLDSSIGVVLESLTGRIQKIISTVLAGKTPGILMNFFGAKKDGAKASR